MIQRLDTRVGFTNALAHPGNVLVGLCVILFCIAGNTATAQTHRRPNVIVIFTDDHGYSDLNCQGVQDDLKTPNIDALAAGGVRMSSGYVTAPQCVPSRAGLLSGRYQNRFGVESNGESLEGFDQEKTVAERLNAAGYATGMTGKWHLGPQQKIVDHGFDDVYYKNANRPGWANFGLDGKDRDPGPEDSKLYHLDANSDAACAFIDRHHDQPFFFYCAYRAPHVPLDAPPKYLSRFPGKMPERRRQALAMISAMDDGVGKIISTLRKHKLEEQTLIFIIGDNGAPLKIHKLDAPGGGPGWDGSLNEPLNGEKGMLSEGGIRVPFLVYWKGAIQGGRVYDHPVISLDVAATATALAGLPQDPQLDGVNLVPFLQGKIETAPHPVLYWRWIAQAAVREGKWKYLKGGTRSYLFDLEADKEEKTNLIQQYPAIANRLQGKLQDWSSELKPPGLNTKQMSQTWENYYDFYLDGKPAPEVRAQVANHPGNGKASSHGWTARNCTLTHKDGTLQVRPHGKKTRPFIVAAGLELPSKVSATVKLRSESAEQLGVQWRQLGQKDFPAEQTARFESTTPKSMQQQRVSISGGNPIIHVRLLLPKAGADIASIQFHSESGQLLKAWDFSR